MSRRNPVLRILIALLFAAIVLPLAVASGEPHWIRVDSSHFTVLTDSDEKHAHEVCVRFEQMRGVFGQLLMRGRVNMPEPIEIVAFRSEDEYEKVAPTGSGAGLSSAFFIPGEDRVYFVLNLSKPDGWRAVSQGFAQTLLNYNYPPTQTWFDLGFAEYFSSVQLSETQMQVGSDPQNFAATLNGTEWMSLPQLFAANPEKLAANQRGLFDAESWAVLHYVLNKDKLPAVGSYFGMVENEKLSADDAIQKAFGLSSAQLAQEVKAYFASLAPTLTAKPLGPNSSASAAPVTADMVGTSTHPVPEPEARAAVAEVTLRVPDHRADARNILNGLVDQPTTDNFVAHRALGWDAMQQNNFNDAIDELGKALTIDSKDPWTHYYLALFRYQNAQSGGHEIQGLANMMQDLHIALDWDHEFAEAYHLLALAQMAGGGMHAATDSIRAAMQLSPRKPGYSLDLARIYEGGKNWDAATALLERLSTNSNQEVASAAKKELQDLPYIKKYGIPPQADTTATAKPAVTSSSVGPSAPTTAAPATKTPPTRSSTTTSSKPASADDNDEAEVPIPAQPQIDKRPIQYAKGKLVSVDCSQSPAATLTVLIAGHTMKLHAADYKSMTLVGANSFSCDWTDRAVSVNYKASTKIEGDLVSLEVH